MWNKPSKERMKRLPKLYDTEHIHAEDKTIAMHFYFGECHWYIVEFDGEDLMFGFVILNGDHLNAEWGYISLNELCEIDIEGAMIVHDVYWTPKRAIEVKNIKESCRWESNSIISQQREAYADNQ